ncbi:DUF6371 domain-containing protein [Proteiniphilum propionicum]|mgnify:CR=1 FL=1|jgi:hypothetical protein|uniref:DUF6371 domain-containing protein n=1 Tax=Proteiniphilum propionicum TaxID=2829812 RepID=UPI001EEC9C06|nr:DUF6371 domain-containing protein [Proteiniphilum propionicum]ULB33913.1 hypothetical protein KDN43_13115 [Proteiniphilum propionicum]
MKEFKYKLEKYKGRTTRHECPHCHTYQSFVRYVDERGNYISDNVGRCNREDKCGYHLTPSEYFKDKGIDYTPTIHVAPKPLPPTDYIPEEMMVRSLNTDNNFIHFLTKYFPLIDVARAIDRYRIGDHKEGRVIYWQIDREDRIRTGKIMLYDPVTGKRAKNVKNSFDWVHRHVKSPYQLSQCLYGLHLVKKSTTPLAVVESEKSAIIASLTIPEYTWVATGGKQNYRLLEALRGHDVTLFPDLGAYHDWTKYATKYGFKVSNLLEQVATDEERRDGLDIADYIIKQMKNEK